MASPLPSTRLRPGLLSAWTLRHSVLLGGVRRAATSDSKAIHEFDDHPMQRLRQQKQHDIVTRLLATTSPRFRTPYELLPELHEALDLLSNPRLSPLVTPIDQRLLAPFYDDVDHQNKRLRFFRAGDDQKPTHSHYVRSFMPHCRQPSNMAYINEGVGLREQESLPWEPLSKLLVDVFASIGVTEFRDFYTHILPARVGRHATHKDDLQSDTWKVDIRFSPLPTELLVLDDTDRRWYALRFAPGGSGFVICSSLFTRFHAVRAGSAIQQSVLAVFNKQGTTQRMVHEALAQRSTETLQLPENYQSGHFREFVLPPAPTRHPRIAETARVAVQSGKHVQNCLELLRDAVRAVHGDSRQPLRETRGWLSRVPATVIDSAIATLSPEVRDDVQRIYENHCKLTQHIASGVRRHTQATKLASTEGGRKNRKVIDDRFISVGGTATIGDRTFHFRDYDGTEATRLRFAWSRFGDRYGITASTESGSEVIKTLASLAMKLGVGSPISSSRCKVYLDVLDGETITGQTAAMLHEHGLTLRVVHIADELDYKVKRIKELERQPLRKRHRQPTEAKPGGFPKRPLSALLHFVQERQPYKLARKAFEDLNPAERKVYEDKATEDQLSYKARLSEARLNPSSKAPKYPLSSWNYFVQNRPLLQFAKDSFAQLSQQEKQVYEDKAQADLRRYQSQLSEWRLDHPTVPTTAFESFRTETGPEMLRKHPEKYAGMEGQADLTKDLRARWQLLGPSVWNLHEQKVQRLWESDTISSSDSATTAASNLSLSQSPSPKRSSDQQGVVDRLLATSSAKSNASYESLPQLFEAPDLLTNPRLSSLVSPIDPRLLAPFYNDIDHHNSRLKFFKTGNETDVSRSHYVRSFMPHCRPSGTEPDALAYVKDPSMDTHDLPWQALSSLLLKVFALAGVTELRDFYTHVMPAVEGRHLPHRDKLQADTWKVDIRMSPSWTELLVLDEEDGRWYALRFSPGGSGFVLDSALFTRFHAVRAGPAIQQSLLAVFHKQGSTQQMMRDALAEVTAGVLPLAAEYHSGPFKRFALPSAPISHPRVGEAARVRIQSTKHRNLCLDMLRDAVRSVDQNQPRDTRIALGRVPRSLIDRALATLSTAVRDDVRKTYEECCKLTQLSNYGARAPTPATKRGSVESGKKKRRILDDRLISISGTAHAGDATLHFREYDGTDATCLRFAWTGFGDRYRTAVCTESLSASTRNLALLAKTLSFERVSLNTFNVNLDIVDGDVLTGKTASLFREHGLTLHVVPTEGELDYTTKRSLELERRLHSTRRVIKKTPPNFPKHPLSPWTCFLQDNLKLTRKVFDELTPEEKMIYRDKAQADQLRYQNQLSDRSTESDERLPKSPMTHWGFFYQDYGKSLKKTFDQLSSSERKAYEDKAEVDRRRYQRQLTEWQSANPKGVASTAYEVFSSETSELLLRQYPTKYGAVDGPEQLRRDLKTHWLRLGSSGWLEYERKATSSTNGSLFAALDPHSSNAPDSER